MQISGVNYTSGSESWKNEASPLNTDILPDDNAMAKESKTTIKDVTSSKENESLKESTDKLKEQQSKNHKTAEIDNTQLNFKVHKGTGEIMIQIIDNDTGKVIREIPPEAILDSIAKIWKNAGIIVDKKV